MSTHKKLLELGKKKHAVTTVCMMRGNMGTYEPNWEPLHVGKVRLYEELLVREKHRLY